MFPREAFIPPWAATEWDLRGWTLEITAADRPARESWRAARRPVRPPPMMTASHADTAPPAIPVPSSRPGITPDPF
jgi:hypothetical protein